jgi:hypothetical protein
MNGSQSLQQRIHGLLATTLGRLKDVGLHLPAGHHPPVGRIDQGE